MTVKHHLFRKFFGDTAGTITLTLAVAAPVVLGSAGLAVDYVRFTKNEANLQALADSAAIAAVNTMSIANTSTTTVRAAAASSANGIQTSAENTAWQKGTDGIGVATDINVGENKVTVTLTQEWSPMLAHIFFDLQTPVVASSTAALVGSGKVCVITLDPSANRALHMDNSAALQGNGCGVFSNSTHTNAIRIDQSAKLIASKICSAGGSLVQNRGFVSPSITEDCPVIADPLAGRSQPAAGACDFTNHVVSGTGNFTLSPGTYCGGLRIEGSVVARLNDGDYIISGGPLELRDTARMEGDAVGFFLTGAGARFSFDNQTSVSLEAQTSGDMAGLLFYEDRANAATTHRISSADARNLLGTIYLSQSALEIDAVANVATDSAYTAIIVNTLQVFEGPTVRLNSNYDATDVPVPPGLIGGRVVLTN